MTDLIKLVKSCSVEEVAKYLQNRIDQSELNSALDVACGQKNKDILKLLLENGGDIHHDSEMPLQITALKNDLDWLKYIVNLGADPGLLSMKCSYRMIESCQISIVEYLLELGMKIKHQMLVIAGAAENLDTFILLRSRMPDADLSAAWEAACVNSSMEIIDYMLDLPLDFDLTQKRLLRNVICCYEIDILKKILNRVLDPKTILDITHLELACDIKSYEIAKIILELGIDPNYRSRVHVDEADNSQEKKQKSYPSPLELALSESENRALFPKVVKPNLKLVKLLLDHGADVTFSCLDTAVGTNDWDIFYLVYQSGSWSDSQISDALDTAIDLNVDEKIWKFLHGEIGDQLDVKNLPSIIHCAIDNENYDMIKYFDNFYGDRLFSLVSFSDIINNIFDNEEYGNFKNFANSYGKDKLFDLVPFENLINSLIKKGHLKAAKCFFELYPYEKICNLIHFDSFDKSTNKDLRKMISKFVDKN